MLTLILRQVLAYGPMDNLRHARKAVEEAEWDVRNFGDQDAGLKLLSIANVTLADVRKSVPTVMNEPMGQEAALPGDRMDVDEPTPEVSTTSLPSARIKIY